ncbi:MAG: aldehyde dehydrogenase family protein [Dehalococcoidia bacterium]|nr:aldehyde dehydrogenase family protein [Dehalococcoidia bacterium]
MALKNYINGKWLESSSGETFLSLNPANGEALGELASSTAKDVDDAVAAAHQAFDSWRKVPAPRRGEIVFRAGEMMLKRKADLGRLLTEEMGKVLPEALGEVQEGIDMTFYMAGEGRRLFGDTVPAELPNKFAMSVREPIGVVGAVTPWNFPFAIPTWKLMPALVAGNTVVFKPSSETSMLAVTLVEMMVEAGLPPGVLNLVLGPGSPVGDAVVEHKGVNLISFTGSTDVGRSILARTAPTLKRVSLEMGGKNAILVMEDADLDLALEGILWSAFGTSGQRCTAASRIVVHRSVKDRLTEMLVERARKLRLGNGLLATTDVGPVVNRAQLEKVHRYTQIGLQEGARLLTGGDICHDGDCDKGYFYKPTIFGDVDPKMRIAQEEIFGPSTAIISVDSLEDAIQVNNGTGYGLVASIYCGDVNRAFRAMRDLSVGIVYVNAGTIGAEIQLPFGGTRGTGNGHREAGQAALDIYTEWKSIYVDYSGRLQRAQIDV